MPFAFRALADFQWRGKVAVLRADFNAPLSGGELADDSRLRACLPTIGAILKNGGGVVCLSHLGRPRGKEKQLSLRPVAERLEKLAQTTVRFLPDFSGARPAAGELCVAENTRFHSGEKENDKALAKQYAALGDIFVFDAFAAAHRREASTCALAEVMSPNVCAGMLAAAEVSAASRALVNPRKPVVLIVGGAKVSDKLGALRNLRKLCARLLCGGGALNTVLAARGINVGKSLVEKTMLDAAKEIAQSFGDAIATAEDAIVADDSGNIRQTPVNEIRADEMIVDIGEKTRARYAAEIQKAGTVIWSGPMGKYEEPPFAVGTRAVAQAAADSPAYILAGGGDTVSAINASGCAKQMDYLSTGGGAFLQMLAGKEMPALAALQKASGL